jgi:TolB protein
LTRQTPGRTLRGVTLRPSGRAAALWIGLLGALVVTTQSAAGAPRTQLVSVGAGGEPANGVSFEPVLARKRLVVWTSEATNLVRNDGNGFADVFARRPPRGATQMVSALPGGGAGPGPSSEPDVTADGRYVSFTAVPDLVPADANGLPDVYVRDLATGRLTLVSVSTAGAQGNDVSHLSAVSYDGRLVAFSSAATNLVRGGNGTHLFGLYLRDLRRGTTVRITTSNSSFFPDLSGNGEALAFQTEIALDPRDTNNQIDVYLADLRTGSFRRVSGGGGSLNGGTPSIDGKGDRVAFPAASSDLDPSGIPISRVFVWDRRSGLTEVVDVNDAGVRGNESSFDASIDRAGRRVAFSSFANNLVAGDTNGSTDVFVRDLRRDTTERVSVGDAGQEADSFSSSPAISPNGRRVAFASDATNLVPGDTNGQGDVFLRRLVRSP